MKSLKLLSILLLFAGLLFAQGELPTDGLVGLWSFDDGANLTGATIGNDLEAGALEGLVPTYTAVPGPEAGNGAVNVTTGSFFSCFHDIEANGLDPAFPDSIPTRVNQFAFVIDFHIPATGVWYGFHASDNNGDPSAGDWDSFLRSNGRLGVGSTGYSYYPVTDTEGWYRLIINADLGVQYKYFLDGQLTQNGSPRSIDDRFSLDSPDGSNTILFFGDNDGEDAAIDVASLAVYDRPLTDEEIVELGGFGHFIPLGTPVGNWTFDDAGDLLAATTGSPLELVGEHATAGGPIDEDPAVSIGVGSHYKAMHGILPNGFVPAGDATAVNAYTVAVDVMVPNLGSFYALLQTDPDNLDDADLFIGPEGRIGSPLLGWSDSTIVKAGEWYRISLAVSQGDTLPNAVIYADGEHVLTKDALTFNDDLALSPNSAANSVLFFADDNGDDNQLSVAIVNIYNRALSSEEQSNLGGYDHKFSVENTPAKLAPVFKLAEATQYAIAPYSDLYDIPEDRNFTVECWVQVGKGISSDPSFLSNKSWDSGGNNGWNLAAKSGTWDINIADTNRTRIDFDPPTLNDGQWHHVGFTITREQPGVLNDSIIVWTDNNYSVNLLLAGSFTPGNELGPCINKDHYPLAFGQDGTEVYPKFPGSLDEVRIWHAALDAETLKEWRHKPVTSAHPNYDALVGYWNFDEVVDGAYPDLSGKGGHAVLMNGPSAKVSYAVVADETVAGLTDVMGIWGAKTEGGPATEGESGGLMISAAFDVDGALAKLNPVKENLLDVNLTSILGFEEEMSAIVGHNNGKAVTSDNLAGGVALRYDRVWAIDITETWSQALSLDFNMTSDAGVADNYVLLAEVGDTFEPIATASSVFGAIVSFEGIAPVDGATFTLGTTDAAASPLGTLTSVDSKTGLPLVFALENAYPNPFNPQTTIEYSLANTSDVTMTVFNSLGQTVAKVVDLKAQPAGQYKAVWNALDRPSGVYFYRIEAGDFVAINKMILLK